MAPKALAGWLVVGAILMAGLTSSLGLRWPFSIERHTDLVVVYAVLGLWCLVYLAITIFIVLDARRRVNRRDLDGLQRAANLIKMTAVWFFLLNFIGLGSLAIAIFRIGRETHRAGLGYSEAGAIIVFVVATYLILLPTSAYGIATLVLLNRDHVIGRAFFRINLVLHFLFILDVLSAVLVVEFARHLLGWTRRPGVMARNLMVGVIYFCSSLSVVWIVGTVVVLIVAPSNSLMLSLIFIFALVSPLSLLLLVIIPAVPILTFRACVRLYFLGDLDTLRRTARTVKLAAVPLFVQNFIVCTALVFAATLFPLAVSRGLIIFAGPLALLVISAFATAGLVPTVTGTYLMMLITSCPGLVTVALLRRSRAVSSGLFALHLILHLVFVADIVSTLVVARRARGLQTPSPPAISSLGEG